MFKLSDDQSGLSLRVENLYVETEALGWLKVAEIKAINVSEHGADCWVMCSEVGEFQSLELWATAERLRVAEMPLLKGADVTLKPFWPIVTD